MLEFDIDGIKIEIPRKAAERYKETLKHDLTADVVKVYLGDTSQLDEKDYINRILDNMFEEIKNYNTFEA